MAGPISQAKLRPEEAHPSPDVICRLMQDMAMMGMPGCWAASWIESLAFQEKQVKNQCQQQMFIVSRTGVVSQCFVSDM